METMITAREQFALTAADLVDTDDSVAIVYAEISGQFFGPVERRHPDRVINVGIREQLLVNVGAGLALTGMRPIVHTFGSFLAERGFEQIKLGFAHQDVGGVLVGGLGSFDAASMGRTHASPGDVALMDTIPGMQIHAPGTAPEVDAVLRRVVAGDGLHYVRVVGQTNKIEVPLGAGFHVVRRGTGPTVLSLGPTLDAVLEATAGLDATVLHATTVRPFDARTLRAVAGRDIVLVEPWFVGTSAHRVAEALADRPHRLLSLGVPRTEFRHYGRVSEHVRAMGLDAAGLRRSIDGFLSLAA
jgi:transketolase